MANVTESFSIDVVGENSGEKFSGNFSTKLRLSHNDQLKMDEIRRKLLGSNHESASVRANNAAEIFSELAINITSSPSWFKNSNNGLDLVDDNVISAIYDGLISLKVKAIDAMKQKTSGDLAAIKAVDLST